MNLPNKLTLLRIILIPVFMVVLYWGFPGATWVALALFFDAQKNQRFPFPISVIFCKSKQKMTKIHFLPFQILTNSHLSCKMWY